MKEQVAVHYAAHTSDWIECFVFTSEENAQEVGDAVRRAMNEYWDSDDLCYGDILEDELEKTGLPFKLVLCNFDDMTDEPTAEWEAYSAAVYQDTTVIEIEI